MPLRRTVQPVLRRWMPVAIGLAVLCGCHRPMATVCTEQELAHYLQTADAMDLSAGSDLGRVSVRTGLPPDEAPQVDWDLTLEEAFRIATSQSKVLRELGGALIRTPEQAKTIYDPAIQQTDPQLGVDAALSAFDANFSLQALGEKNNQMMNNSVFGELGHLRQDQFEVDATLSKRSATGGLFTIRERSIYAADNTPTNQFPAAWQEVIEGEFRQPLLQGAGAAFNRLAGPGAGPGTVNGVVIARIRNAVGLADFELGVRDMLSDVENAYWDLYFAYRDLETKKTARDLSLITWNYLKVHHETGSIDEANEAQAREQYFRFEEEVNNALYGQLLEGTRNNNGSAGGTFRANPGVRAAERRLRFLLGLPESDGRLIRPADEPCMSRVKFDWGCCTAEALVRRADLRRQREQVRRRQLEVIAERNHLLPSLDLVGRYRFQGLGRYLIGDGGADAKFPDSAFADMPDYSDWQLGMELSTPLGFRKEHAAVRNAELRVARERAILDEQQRQAIDNLAGAIVDVRRAYEAYTLAWNRCLAAQTQVKALQARFHQDKVQLDVYLEAQRHLAESQSQLYQVQVEYVLALKNVHFEKGSLLDYCGVHLSEEPSAVGCPKIHFTAPPSVTAGVAPE